jgi:hypothetical protein
MQSIPDRRKARGKRYSGELLWAVICNVHPPHGLDIVPTRRRASSEGRMPVYNSRFTNG